MYIGLLSDGSKSYLDMQVDWGNETPNKDLYKIASAMPTLEEGNASLLGLSPRDVRNIKRPSNGIHSQKYDVAYPDLMNALIIQILFFV